MTKPSAWTEEEIEQAIDSLDDILSTNNSFVDSNGVLVKICRALLEQIHELRRKLDELDRSAVRKRDPWDDRP